MRILSFCIIFLFAHLLIAQEKIDFENFGLESNEFLNGSDLNGGFNAGSIFLPNGYDETYGSWEGWSISAVKDSVTAGFSNQFASITESGNEGSMTYAVTSAFGNVGIELDDFAKGASVSGMYITNSTYAYISMREGDAFAKKFGGVTGDDPDYFYITIKGYFEGALVDEEVIFYLADFRSDDNTQDYILNEWTFVDLSVLGQVDQLEFSLTSSDVGSFGINTPSYFCIDDISLDLSTSIDDIDEAEWTIYPNPTTDGVLIEVDGETEKRLTVMNAQGQIMEEINFSERIKYISFDKYPKGNYLINLNGKQISSQRMIVKI